MHRDDRQSLTAWFEALDKARRVEPADAVLAAPFAPPPWPRAEMNAMFRLLAAERGLAQRCANKRCRRAGACAEGFAGGASACIDLWDEAGLETLRAAWLALVLAWLAERERGAAFCVDAADMG